MYDCLKRIVKIHSFRIAPAAFALDDKQAKKLWEVTNNTFQLSNLPFLVEAATTEEKVLLPDAETLKSERVSPKEPLGGAELLKQELTHSQV